MPRRRRHLPTPESLVLVTLRVIQARFLLAPTSAVIGQTYLGVLGRAQRLFPIKIIGHVSAGNHVHLLVQPGTARRLSQFMGHFAGNLSKKIGKLVDWRGSFWERRYTGQVVSDEDQAQLEIFAYLLAHGAKEGLVADPRQWPGPHCAKTLCEGRTKEPGIWINETKKRKLRRAGKIPRRRDYAEREVVTLSKLPCLAHLSDEEYTARVRQMVDELVEQHAKLRAETGREPLGAAAILAQDPHRRPPRPKRSPAKAFLTASKQAYDELRHAYNLFCWDYDQAKQAYANGQLEVAFPADCWPPRPPPELACRAGPPAPPALVQRQRLIDPDLRVLRGPASVYLSKSISALRPRPKLDLASSDRTRGRFRSSRGRSEARSAA